MSKIGLLGGAFDPIHCGHIALAKAAQDRLGLEQIWLLPSGRHRFKQEKAPFSLRFSWVERAVAAYPGLEARRDDCQAGISYTSELVQNLPSEHRYYFLIGADNLPGLPQWHRFAWLWENLRFVVVERPGAAKLRTDDPLADKLIRLPMEPQAISSSQIRENPFLWQNKLPKVIRKEVLDFYGEAHEKK